MRIIGIDPALTITGYGLIDSTAKGIFLVEAGSIRTKARQSLPVRLMAIHDSLLGIIARLKPDTLVLEKVFVHGHHPATAFLLGQARGIVCLAAQENGLPVEEYAPNRVKIAVTGNGHADKLQVQRMVANILGLEVLPKHYDVTDALALALTCGQSGKASRLRDNK